MSDKIIGHAEDGHPVYDNTPTVVCLLARAGGKLVTVRRAHNPGIGLIGLPGGFQMRGETWQQCGVRELREETGYEMDPDRIHLWSLITDSDGHNLIIGFCTAEVSGVAKPDPAEVQEILYLEAAGRVSDWAFEEHHHAALSELEGE